MLGNKNVIATVAVKDLETAKEFYEGKLSLEVANAQMQGITYNCGSTHLFVYQSDFAGTNKATAASWSIGDEIENTVKELQDKGITFEEYDIPNSTRNGAIHEMGELKSAWFTDPDGNILNLNNM